MSTIDPTEESPELVRAERDLYRRLLDLGDHDDLGSFVDDALELITEATGAQQAFLALDPVAPGGAPFAIARGCTESDVAAIRRELSQGIVAEALRTGRTVSTASAVDDPRFSAMVSVQANRIRAVLCAPVGGARAFGALYLQGRPGPGPFSEHHRRITEAFALRIAPLADRLRRAPKAAVDHSAEARSRLVADSIVGGSRAIGEMLRHVVVAAQVDLPVLLQGESGTGKTEVARCLHASSRRAAKPFVEVNCAALPETLLEAELFGAEKGSHSTATRRMPGRIAAAEGGTLFLDEVGELPLASQPKLLQFLQSRQYWRLGGDSAVTADVRVVAATNLDLAAAVQSKRFREDLYYRLNVLQVRVPALRERPDDIAPIANFHARAAALSMGREMSLSFGALAALRATEWPGNVRQLAAAVQRGAAFALGEQASEIEAWHLFPDAPRTSTEPAGAALNWQDATRRFQRKLLEETLAASDGNVSEVGRRLDIARSHLHELLRAHGLQRRPAGG